MTTRDEHSTGLRSRHAYGRVRRRSCVPPVARSESPGGPACGDPCSHPAGIRGVQPPVPYGSKNRARIRRAGRVQRDRGTSTVGVCPDRDAYSRATRRGDFRRRAARTSSTTEPAEAAAGEPRAVARAARSAADRTSRSTSGTDTCEVVALRGVRRVEQAAERARDRRAHRVHGVEHALVLGDDVARAAVERLRQRHHARRDRRSSRSRSCGTPSSRGGALALGAAGAVVAGRVVVRDAGVDDDELGAGAAAAPARTRASACRGRAPCLVVGEARRHLVHDADRRADEVVLRPAARAAPASRRRASSPKSVAQRAQDGDLERGARRQAAAERHVGATREIEAAERDAAPRRAPACTPCT